MTQDEIGVSVDINEIEIEVLDRGDQLQIQPQIEDDGDKKDMPFEVGGDGLLDKKAKSDKALLNLTSGSGQTCRICWGSEEDGDYSLKDYNPLISPCSCIGTVQAIHLKCLKEWLETKRTMKVHRGQVIIKFKKLDCELCK